MNQMQQIENYKKQIYRKIPAAASTKSRCIDRFNVSIEDYFAEYPKASLDEIIGTFGPPKEVAQQYEQEIDPEEIRKYKRRRILCWTIPLAVFLILICVFLIWGYFHIISQAPEIIVESPVTDVDLPNNFAETFEN